MHQRQLFSGLDEGSPIRRNGYGAVVRLDSENNQDNHDQDEDEEEEEYEEEEYAEEDEEEEDELPPLRLNLFTAGTTNYPLPIVEEATVE